MQTEIGFLLDILLDEELSVKVQKLIRKRIREVELNLGTKPAIVQRPVIQPTTLQAPSTQRLLDEMAAETGAPTPVMVAPRPQVSASARIVGGEVQTGNGTKGPRKF